MLPSWMKAAATAPTGRGRPQKTRNKCRNRTDSVRQVAQPTDSAMVVCGCCFEGPCQKLTSGTASSSERGRGANISWLLRVNLETSGALVRSVH